MRWGFGAALLAPAGSVQSNAWRAVGQIGSKMP
jgi:hypothetical protein